MRSWLLWYYNMLERIKSKTQMKEKQHFLSKRRYTGQNNQLLEKFINQHRTAYTRLEEGSERVVSRVAQW